ncbi:putative ubiquitin-conjugating enzyme E2 24 [Bidens hawaiensis]|uniref:putative ubiquitin-conjugating enzyme E2 24 n=1 Tax=Bidens hawaiensis TaxID=980011 RepID=UPI00404B9807
MDVFFNDFDSYSESSSLYDHENDDDELMYGGQASSILSNLEQTIGKIDDFLTFEREYVYGDIVCSSIDPSGQMGKVINVEKVVDLESAHGNKLKDITSKKLKRVCSISIGDYVVMGHWLGKAERIVDRVSVIFDDGMTGEFTALDDAMLVPLSSDSFHDSQFPYFREQRVKIKVKSCFNWFCGNEEYKHNEGTVCAVNVGFVYVKWLSCGSERTTVPDTFQRSEHLTVLTCFTHSNWNIGDWCVVPGFQEIFVVSKTKSKVSVLWQDGSESHSLDLGCVSPVNIIDQHDFWPHQFVAEKGTSDDQENKKWGVVKTVDASEKNVKVKWEKDGVEETASAYELIEHTKFLYCYGDVVFGLEKSCHIGVVIGFKDGRVEVKWAGGFTSKVAPNEIIRMDKSEGVVDTLMLYHDNVDTNQEKSEHDAHLTDPKPKDVLDHVYGNKKECLNVPQIAISFLSDVASRLFGSSVYTSLSRFSKEDNQEQTMVSGETNMVSNIKENDEDKDFIVSSSSKNLEKVENFKMVSDCSMHHFVDRAGKDSIGNQVKRSWLKKVRQEWNILMKDLPETIYVRVFEERMDLLRVAIVGAPGTPYHDVLFFFDIFLPPEYPHEPPMVHYISGGLRINPNLYESGRVCLSLLNTWTGTGSETWDPKGSSILQVVLSLQALVLNKNPYFNEAGYDQQVGSVEGEKNCCSYNENVFLMNCKTILFALRNPPQHFEALVEEHFRKRCGYLLMACKAYMEGVPVCYAFGDERIDPKGQIKGSTGFKISLSKLFTKLAEAFSKHGFNCGESP